MQTVIIKFDNQLIKSELPVPDGFTGDIQLIFHWKGGKLMKAEASKHSSVEISTDTGLDIKE